MVSFFIIENLKYYIRSDLYVFSLYVVCGLMKSKLSELYVKNWYEEKVMKIKELRIEMIVKLNKGF